MEDQKQLILFPIPDTDGKTVKVQYQDETYWMTQLEMAKLFQTTQQNISLHIKNIIETQELPWNSVHKEILIKSSDEKYYKKLHYNLDMIISVGYRVNAKRGTAFRQWATQHLKNIILKGYSLDEERLSRDSQRAEELYQRMRALRTSEKEGHQKLITILATCSDYDPKSPDARNFFASIQNKIHYTVHRHTAAELIVERSDPKKPHMGLTNWGGDKDIRRVDTVVAKNYLSDLELELSAIVVNQIISHAEYQYKARRFPTVNEMIRGIDVIIENTGGALLQGLGRVSHDQMKEIVKKRIAQYWKNRDNGMFPADMLPDRTKKKEVA